MIETGILRPRERMPSSRVLAADLGVARSVVVEAYQQLAAEGYLASASRSGTRVADLVRARTAQTPEREAWLASGPAIRWDLRTGLADIGGFPRSEWAACLQQAVQSAAPEHLEYPPLSGINELRTELAAYLGRVRAVQASPELIMLTAGFAEGLAMLCRLLRNHGSSTIAVEDPGHPYERQFIEQIPMRTVPVPVDSEGIDVAALAGTDTRAVLVTPAHQFPTGATLSPRRRAALIDWADRVDGLIIEDDYDGEYWFDRATRPPSLQSLAPDRVVYGGSVSKILAPGLRLGWLAVPERIMPDLERIRGCHDLGKSTIDQLAYAVFIRTGRLDRHLRRSRQRYRQRLETLVDALAACLPGAHVVGPAAGLHAFVALPDDVDEGTLVREAGRQGVLVRGASHFAHACRPSPGLVIGYASHHHDSLAAAVATLAKAARPANRPIRFAPRSMTGASRQAS